MGVKIVHGADLHLESVFRGLSQDKANLRRGELRSAFLRVVETASEQEADLLLLAGDLFEHQRADRELANFLDSEFRKLKARVFIAPGNHDPAMPGSLYLNYPWSENVHIFSESLESIYLQELGCVVHGLGFAHFAVKEPLLSGFRVKDPDMINIVLMHGDDCTNPLASGNSNYLPFNLQQIQASGADYFALGHQHNLKIVWEESGSLKACYPGSVEPLGFNEEGEHGIICGTVGKERNRLSFVKLNLRCYHTSTIKCSGQEYLEQLVELTLKQLPASLRSQNFVRLVYKGEVSPSLEFNKYSLESLLSEHFFCCRVENCTVPCYDLTQFEQRTARGMYASRIQALIDLAQSEEEREILRQSLFLGLDALNLGKVVER